MVLENPIVRNHDWDHNQVLSLRGNVPVCIDEPLNGEVRGRAPVELAGSKAFRVLEDHRELVVFDDLLEHC